MHDRRNRPICSPSSDLVDSNSPGAQLVGCDIRLGIEFPVSQCVALTLDRHSVRGGFDAEAQHGGKCRTGKSRSIRPVDRAMYGDEKSSFRTVQQVDLPYGDIRVDRHLIQEALEPARKARYRQIIE